MKRQWATIMGVVAAAVLPSIASAGVIMEVVPAADPAPGLQAMTVRAIGTDGLKISSIAGLNLTGAHQVWPFGGDSSEPSDLAGPLWNPAWTPLDSHFMLDKGVGFITSPGMGVAETNNLANPAGLTTQLSSPLGSTFDGKAGMGNTYFTPDSNAQVTYAGAATFPAQVDFLYVVVPTGGTALLDVKFIDSSSSGFISYTAFPVTAAIPEPALGLIALPALAFLRRRRS